MWEAQVETVTIAEAKALIRCLAHTQSILLLSSPGVGKSDLVRQAAAEAGLPCKSLLGTQIAPEDVSGIPRIVGERSVFCPPRVLLDEDPRPFCLFLDELPACAPDVQKAFYSLLLERRLGEHTLAPGTWVVAAGNRAGDRSLVRTMSSALVNRVLILQVRVDIGEWLAWARTSGVRPEIQAFIRLRPEALSRPIPGRPAPFSTPRAWASLSRAFDLAEAAGVLADSSICRSLVEGRVSDLDANAFLMYPPIELLQLNDPQKARLWDVFSMSIEDLNLSVRATNVLMSGDIDTVLDLLGRTEEDLLCIRNLGERVLTEIKTRLAELGVSLRSP